ncbi:MAG: SH3 domain-containing protein [Caldilineaceae bacterium]
MSQATMTFQTKEQHSPRYNWRSVLVTLFIFALIGGGGWWADQAGWLDRFLGQNTAVVTTANSQAPANQTQTTNATASNAQAPIAQRTQTSVMTKTTTTSKVSNKATATPAVAPVTLPVVAGVHGAQLWDQTGKPLTTLDIGALLTAKGRSADSAWLAVTTNAGAGWVQTSQVVAYDVQSLPVVTPPTAVTTTTATTAAVSPAAVTTPVATQLTATVSTANGRLNVRSGPGTDYAILAKVNTGDELVVRGRNATGDWLQVQVAGATAGTGWVSAQYVTFNGDLNALPVSTT